LETLDGLLPELPHPLSLLWRAVLLAMLDRFQEAQPLAAHADERLRELTGDASGEFMLSLVARLSGDLEGAAAALRRHCEMLQERGLRMRLSSYAPYLGRWLCSLGRYDDAVPLVQLSREVGDEQDTLTQMLWRQAQALIHAGRGQHTQAEQLARDAVAISQRSDGLNFQGDALCDLAEVLAAAGRTDEAVIVLGEAQDRYKRKRNLPMAAHVRARVAELRGEAVPT
jgi:ATP/maltotriose-dependent transcriptional regulator MalT